MNVDPWSNMDALAKRADVGPVTMLNLLKFKPGGEQRYLEGYASVAVPMIERLGGRIVYAGRFAERVHDDDAPEWDVLVLVEYPNRQAFIDMVNNPAYREAHVHRSEAVERARELARPGDVVLLSPACATSGGRGAGLDEFASYEERGERFRELVREIVAAAPA